MSNFKSIASLLFVILLTSCTSSVWVHKDFETIKDNVETITIMPPQFEYFERLAGSTEPKPERIPEVVDNVQTALNEVLTEGGFTVMPSVLTDILLKENQELALCLTRSQKKSSAICDSIGRLKIKKETYTMDPEIGVFADRANANYLLFNRGIAYGTSGGAKTKDVALAVLAGLLGGHGTVSSAQWEGLILEFLLVDATTTEAIWYNGNKKMVELNPFDLEAVKRLCKSHLGNKLIDKK